MTREPAILALDQGTSSSRAVLFGHDGQVVAQESREFRQIYPRPGWVEHDPETIWDSQIDAARALLQRAIAAQHEIVAIGLTNQRETTLVWERETGKPVHNAIVWQDRRTAGICDDLRNRDAEESIHQKTGLVLDPYFSGTKLKWLLDTVPGLRDRASRGEVLFGTVDSYLIYRLTGGRIHMTDYSNASRTLLFNINTLEWDDEILAELDIPRQMLPEVRQSSAEYGHVDASVLGLDIPIAGVAGDQQAATFGQTCYSPGMAKQTYGTGSFMLMNIGDTPVTSNTGLLTTIAWSVDGAVTYALEGAIFVTGAAVQWLRDGLGIIDNAAESDVLAASVESTGGVYLVPAFAGLGRTLLGSVRTRHDRRNDARHRPGRDRASDTGVGCLPDAGCARGDAAGDRHRLEGVARRWWHGWERIPDAVSGRHHRQAS